MSRTRSIRRTALAAALIACFAGADPAAAALGFPGNGWTNPVAGATYEDWHFGSCDGFYIAGVAHLGTDSQGTSAGQAVRAVGAGTVVQVHNDSWPGDAVGIETTAGDGSRFLAVYGHIDRAVGSGQAVAAGQQIGTIYNQGTNSHLHLGVRPLGAAESGGSVSMRGSSACSGGAAASYGYTAPIQWLAAHAPGVSPRGAYDEAAGLPGAIRVRGWAFDDDNRGAAIEMHAYVGGEAGQPGAEGHAFVANGARPDVGAAYPGAGDGHGLDVTFETGKRGSVAVCLYAINIGSGANVLLGCKTVDVAGPDPFGAYDALTSPAGGKLRLRGWSIDPNEVTAPLDMHVYVGGSAGTPGAEGHAFVASALRADVGAAFPGSGDHHGLDVTFTTSKRGSQQVCLYAIDRGPGENVSLGCKTVTVVAPPPTCPAGLVGTPPNCSSPPPPPPPPPPAQSLCRVPDLVGMTRARARAALEGAGCRLGHVKRLRGDGHSRRRVVRQRPKAGAELPAGTRVRLVVKRVRRSAIGA